MGEEIFHLGQNLKFLPMQYKIVIVKIDIYLLLAASLKLIIVFQYYSPIYVISIYIINTS